MKIITDFPIAFDSPDHITPFGTRRDNTKNPKFTQACLRHLTQNKITTRKILDIGCAGGGCVEDFIIAGWDAYGIEGSDYSLKHKRAAWATIPDHLFTCDASRPFQMQYKDEDVQFDIIYSFEVMEHIHPSRLSIYFANIHKHLSKHGLFVGSFTCKDSVKHPGYHQTIMNPKQWFRYVEKLNLFRKISLKWKREEYLRFPGNGRYRKNNCTPMSLQKLR